MPFRLCLCWQHVLKTSTLRWHCVDVASVLRQLLTSCLCHLPFLAIFVYICQSQYGWLSSHFMTLSYLSGSVSQLRVWAFWGSRGIGAYKNSPLRFLGHLSKLRSVLVCWLLIFATRNRCMLSSCLLSCHKSQPMTAILFLILMAFAASCWSSSVVFAVLWQC